MFILTSPHKGLNIEQNADVHVTLATHA